MGCSTMTPGFATGAWNGQCLSQMVDWKNPTRFVRNSTMKRFGVPHGPGVREWSWGLPWGSGFRALGKDLQHPLVGEQPTAADRSGRGASSAFRLPIARCTAACSGSAPPRRGRHSLRAIADRRSKSCPGLRQADRYTNSPADAELFGLVAGAGFEPGFAGAHPEATHALLLAAHAHPPAADRSGRGASSAFRLPIARCTAACSGSAPPRRGRHSLRAIADRRSKSCPGLRQADRYTNSPADAELFELVAGAGFEPATFGL